MVYKKQGIKDWKGLAIGTQVTVRLVLSGKHETSQCLWARPPRSSGRRAELHYACTRAGFMLCTCRGGDSGSRSAWSTACSLGKTSALRLFYCDYSRP